MPSSPMAWAVRLDLLDQALHRLGHFGRLGLAAWDQLAQEPRRGDELRVRVRPANHVPDALGIDRGVGPLAPAPP